MKINYKTLGLIALPVAILASLFVGTSSASATSYNYTSYPMDDTTFRASFTMSAADIQNFLVSKNSGLANFTDVENCGSTSGSHYAFYATYYHCGTTQRASQIIYDAAQAYGINPRVILATLQKEQSLITSPNPIASQLNYAMGYGCPDSGGCSVSGFFNQIDNGVWQFRADYELSSGNNYWGYGPSDYPCNGATRYYNNRLVPGQDVIFIDDHGTGYARFVIPNAATATLYCYTPHVFPGSSQQYYSGSYWFVYYYSQWFGANTVPYSFKSSTSPTIYIFLNGYKVSVPDFAILQDYGISPQSVQVLSQSAVDAIPTPSVASNGISPTLSYVIKSPSDSDNDGGAVYLISVGQKNAFVSMSQFTGFDFNTSQISYFPLSFIASINGISPLYNYVTTPSSSAFQINVNKKRIIFDYQTYLDLNPGNLTTLLSYNVVNNIPSGIPLTNRDVIVKAIGSPTLYELYNNQYYTIASTDAYKCWGLDSTPTYQLADNSYVAPISPTTSLNNCVINNGSGTTYLLNGNGKLPISSAYGTFSSQTLSSDLNTFSNKFPTASISLKQYIKSAASSAVWYLDSGVRKLVPSLSNFNLLGLAASSVDTINSASISSISESGLKLGTGQVVKSESSGTVYAISGNTRIAYSNGNDFQAYRNSWSSVEVYSQALLDQSYPTSGQVISPYYYNSSGNNLYLMDSNGCYMLNSSLQNNYGKNQSTIASSQTYSASIFPGLNLVHCRLASVFVKQPGQGTIYWISDGKKHPFSSWSALVQLSGSNNPDIINLSSTNLQTFPNGPTL